MSQCVNVPIGASGSSQMRAKAFVFIGAPDHSSRGEMSSAWPVYLSGMASPLAKAGLVICMVAVVVVALVLSGSAWFEQLDSHRPASRVETRMNVFLID